MLTRLAEPYRQVFRFPRFRSFWLGFSASVVGDALSRVALTWYVYETAGSAQALGWLAFCYTAPVLAGGFAAGWLLDRFGRRRIMLLDNLLRAGVMLVVPMLHALGQLALWHIYLAAAVYGLLLMIPLAGAPALVPALVPREQLATANALETLSFTLGGVVGPPLAGWLIPVMGALNLLVIDALSYLLFAAALTRLAGLPDPAEAERVSGERRGGGLAEAMTLLGRNPVLLSTTVMFMAFNLGYGSAAVWLPILAGDVLDGGPTLYGTLLGCLAVGEVASALLAGGLARPLPLGSLIALAQLASGAALALLVAARAPLLAAGGLALFGAFSAPLTIWAQTLRMRVIPEPLRGRAFALLRTLMQGAGPLGGLLAGWALPVLGLPAMVAVSAVVVGAPGLAGLGVRALRTAREAPDA